MNYVNVIITLLSVSILTLSVLMILSVRRNYRALVLFQMANFYFENGNEELGLAAYKIGMDIEEGADKKTQGLPLR